MSSLLDCAAFGYAAESNAAAETREVNHSAVESLRTRGTMYRSVWSVDRIDAIFDIESVACEKRHKRGQSVYKQHRSCARGVHEPCLAQGSPRQQPGSQAAQVADVHTLVLRGSPRTFYQARRQALGGLHLRRRGTPAGMGQDRRGHAGDRERVRSWIIFLSR